MVTQELIEVAELPAARANRAYELLERAHIVLQKLRGLRRLDLAICVKQVADFGDIRFRLLHHRYVQIHEGLTQRVVRPEGSEVVRRNADDSRRLAVEHILSTRPRG